MLDSKAAEGKLVKSSSTVESREQALQNPSTEELDISEVFKLEADTDDNNDNGENDENGGSDGDEQTNTETRCNFEPRGGDEVKVEAQEWISSFLSQSLWDKNGFFLFFSQFLPNYKLRRNRKFLILPGGEF